MAETLIQALSSYCGTEPLTPRTQDYLRHLQSLMQPDAATIRTGMHHGEQSKYASVSFSEAFVRKYREIELIQITDVQFGSKACNVKRLLEYRDWCIEIPNRFVLLTGDNIDAATIFSPGTPWDNWFQPQSQIYRFCEIFAPIRHRILAYVGGNHERRSIPAFGDAGTLIATLLKVPYSSGQLLLDIHFGKHQPFKVHLWHGMGGARTKGTVAQVLDRFMQKGDSQLYAMGHLHQAMVLPGWRMERDNKGGIRLKKIMGMIGTSFLDYFGSYGEVMGLTAGEVLMGRVVLTQDGGFEVTLK
jgi:Calcineurin-like phosphoesterase